MTICIAAVCDGGKTVMVASDRMITVSHLSQEFEHGIPKMETISNSCLAVTAGSALVPRELFSNIRKWTSNISNPSIEQIVKRVKDNFNRLRIEKAEEIYLKSRGFESVTDFYEKSRALPPELVVPLDEKIAKEELGVEILIAGVDNDGAHIYWVTEPGTSNCFDSICYSAVGSGEPHALHTFISESYEDKLPLNEALFVIYEAKRNAENAPGVGRSTDIWIISKNEIKKIKEETLKKLEEIYDLKKGFLKTSNEQIDKAIRELNI